MAGRPWWDPAGILAAQRQFPGMQYDPVSSGELGLANPEVIDQVLADEAVAAAAERARAGGALAAAGTNALSQLRSWLRAMNDTLPRQTRGVPVLDNDHPLLGNRRGFTALAEVFGQSCRGFGEQLPLGDRPARQHRPGRPSATPAAPTTPRRRWRPRLRRRWSARAAPACVRIAIGGWYKPKHERTDDKRRCAPRDALSKSTRSDAMQSSCKLTWRRTAPRATRIDRCRPSAAAARRAGAGPLLRSWGQSSPRLQPAARAAARRRARDARLFAARRVAAAHVHRAVEGPLRRAAEGWRRRRLLPRRDRSRRPHRHWTCAIEPKPSLSSHPDVARPALRRVPLGDPRVGTPARSPLSCNRGLHTPKVLLPTASNTKQNFSPASSRSHSSPR